MGGLMSGNLASDIALTYIHVTDSTESVFTFEVHILAS